MSSIGGTVAGHQIARMKPKAAILTLLLLVGVLGSLQFHQWYVQSISAPSIGATVEPGSLGRQWDYVVYQDGSSILAINGQTGANQFSSTSATTIWNNIIASGRSMFWKAGTYDFVGGVAIDGLTNVQLEGEFNQTIFQCTVPACVSLTIGNQNDNTGNFAAQFVTVRNIVFDGGDSDAGNSAGLSIAAAKNVWIDHAVFQNAPELGTGGFRISRWSSTQAFNQNIYVENSYFYRQKISIIGVTNGHLINSRFEGLAPGASGTKAMLDFSNGDETPPIQRVTNFRFSHNTITGWTLHAILGFQSVLNSEISYNIIENSVNFMETVDVGTKDLNGLLVAYNTCRSCTGAMTFNYGHNITIIGNYWAVDSTPASGSTALTICATATNRVDCSDISVINNRLDKWGGVGMYLNQTRGIVQGNYILNMNQAGGNANSNSGFLLAKGLLNVALIDNTIISTPASGAGQSRPVHYLGAAKNSTLYLNHFFYEADTSPSGPLFFGTAQDTSFEIRYNYGYVTENQGGTSVADGGTITHGLAGSPTSVQCTTSISGEFCSVTAKSATTFTVAIKTHAGAAGTTQTIYWGAFYWP